MKLSYKKLALIFFVAYCLTVGADRFTGGVFYILLGIFSLILIAKYKIDNFGTYGIIVLLVGLYGVLSYIGILRNPWGQYYSDANLLRQLTIYLVFVFCTAASTIIFTKYISVKIDVNWKFVAGIYALATLSEYFFVYIHRLDNPTSPIYIGGLNNAEFLFLAFLGAWLLALNRRPLFKSLIIIGCLAISANSQAYVVLLLLLLLLISNNVKIILIVYTISLIALSIFLIINPYFFADFNTVIRALYWRDAVKTLFDHQMFFGVGFGGEWIKNWYPESTKIEMFDDGSQEMINTGLHNSIISIIFRMGLPGFLVIMFLIFHLLRKSFSSKLKSYLYILIITSLTVNVALESPLFNLSIALAWGYIISERKLNFHRPLKNSPAASAAGGTM